MKTLLSVGTLLMTCPMLIMPGVLRYLLLKMDSVKMHNVKIRSTMHAESRDSINVNKSLSIVTRSLFYVKIFLFAAASKSKRSSSRDTDFCQTNLK